MINLDKYKIENLPFEYKFKRHLIYYEGALLSLFVDIDTMEYYLFNWLDVDETHNRWLVYKITKEDLNNIVNKTQNCYDVLMKNIYSYIIDINNDVEFENVYLLEVKYLPSEYLPSKIPIESELLSNIENLFK